MCEIHTVMCILLALYISSLNKPNPNLLVNVPSNTSVVYSQNGKFKKKKKGVREILPLASRQQTVEMSEPVQPCCVRTTHSHPKAEELNTIRKQKIHFRKTQNI